MKETGTYFYSVIRAVPSQLRDESINLGVIVVASDGSFSDFAHVPPSRVKTLDPRADTKSIELFLEGVRDRLPLHGRQSPITGPSRPLTEAVLMDWSREFGGQVQITPPRVTLGDDPKSVLEELLRELVLPLRHEPVTRGSAVGRADILRVLDENVSSWNIAPELVVRDQAWHGRRAEHYVDRVFLSALRSPIALVHAVSFQAASLSDIYGARAALIVATEDTREQRGQQQLRSFAVYADAPGDREAIVRESNELFAARSIRPVNYHNLSDLRADIGAVLIS